MQSAASLDVSRPPVAFQSNGSGRKPCGKLAVEASFRESHLVPSTVNSCRRHAHAVACLSNRRSEATALRQLQRGSYFRGDYWKDSFKGDRVKCRSNEILGHRRRYHSRVTAFAKNPAVVETKDAPTLRGLYPSSSSHKQGYVQVSKLHTIYYEVFGNPKGRPAVFLHGGPGAGCTGNHSRFFDPEHYRIVLFDQRGCGKSTPRGCLEENDTWELVEDLEKLRKELDIEKWLVAGGSWGTTLALAYAQTHPERVAAMVLRAVCMMRKREIDWFYKQGADALFPFAWDSYVAHIPEPERADLSGAYYRRLTSNDKQMAEAAAKSWFRWEMSLLSFSNMPVVISWDGKEYKSLPTPVAASSPAPSPSPSTAVSAAVNPKPPSVPSTSNPEAGSAATPGSSPNGSAVKSSVNSDLPSTTGDSVGIEGAAEVTVSVAETKSEEAEQNERPAASSGVGTSGTAENSGNGRQLAGTCQPGTNLSSGENSGQGKESSGVQNGNRNENKGSQNGTQNGTQNGSQVIVEGVGGSTSGGESEGGSTSDNGREMEKNPSAENMKGGDWMSSTLAQARLESHYSINGAFLSEDQLLNGIDRIRSIPTVAVQGRYDFVCPMKTAFDLHSAWPEMELRVVPNAGHSMYEPGITHEIIEATDKYGRLE